VFDFDTIDSGATAWVLVSAALVLLMTPGIALFYGGMVRAKHVLSMIVQGFMVMALAMLVWVLVAYSLAYGAGNPLIGDLHFAGLANINEVVPGYTGERAMVIPPLVFVIFTMMFAVLTPALITGATADRWRLEAFVPFVVLWSIVVYAPIAHWVFSPQGWAERMGALDFAGGTVVHSTAGAAGLAMAMVLGRRQGWPWPNDSNDTRSHNLPLMLIGTALLWFGWLGFNAGSALRLAHPDAPAYGNTAAYAFLNTNIAAAVAMLVWVVVQRIAGGKATSLGAASGVVAGLVAITPAAGYVKPAGAIAIGVLAALACGLAINLKNRLGYDDSLDVAGLHLVGGVVGSLGVGLFADREVNPLGHDGLFSGGGLAQLGYQAVTVVAVVAYAFVMSYLLGRFIGRLLGNRGRVAPEHELRGLDQSVHGESAYRHLLAPDELPPK
jgi:Amt family ammonium transporter